MSESATSIREELRRRARERGRLRVWRASVVATRQLTPRVRRLTLAGADLRALGVDALPADGFRAAVLPPGAGPPPEMTLGQRGVLVARGATPAWRSYTVRHHDPATTQTRVDVVLHDESAGSQWAASLQIGDEVAGHGPRSDFYAAPGIDHHLLVGDDTAVPAIAAIVEALPDGADVRVIVEVQDEAERVDLPASAAVTWLFRGDTAPGRSGQLAAAVREIPALTGVVQAWAGAESAAVREIRHHLLRERGLANRNVHAVGFWRLGHVAGESP